jgi:hypothetical protein
MGNSQVFIAKIVWDYYWYWAVVCPMFFQNKLTDLAFADSVADYVRRSNRLSDLMQELFIQWNELDPDPPTSDYYVDIAPFDTMTRMHDELGGDFTDDELRENFDRNVKLLEDLVIEWFWRAVQVLPDPPERQAIDPYKVSLDRDRWAADGLFVDGPERITNPDLAKELASVWFTPTYTR